MKRSSLLAFALVPLLVVGGCSGNSAPPAEVPTETPTIQTPSPTPSPTPSVTTPAASPSAPAALSGGPVLAVKIDHTTDSSPRYGLGSADVVYVEPVEAQLTRLMAIYSSSMPSKIGPIRSARESDPDILANYGPVAFAFSGASSYSLGIVRRGAQKNVINDAGDPGFYRDKGRSAPNNLMGDPSKLLAAAGGSVPPADVGFRFGPAAAGGTSGAKVKTAWASSWIQFDFDPGSARYTIVSDGLAEKDALDGSPVLAANIIVQYVTLTGSTGNIDKYGNATPVLGMTGTGKATVLRDGQAWNGTWSRETGTSPTTFTGADGQPLTLASGQTWVLLVPRGQAVTVS